MVTGSLIVIQIIQQIKTVWSFANTIIDDSDYLLAIFVLFFQNFPCKNTFTVKKFTVNVNIVSYTVRKIFSFIALIV